MPDSTERRTRDAILADWEKSSDEPDPNAMLDKRLALLIESIHLNPVPFIMWGWITGEFGAARDIQKMVGE